MSKYRPEEHYKYSAHSVKQNRPKRVDRAIPVKPVKRGDGTIVADGVKIGKVKEPGKIEIYDRDKRRQEHKGRDRVIVDVEDLQKLCDDCPKENDTEEDTKTEFDDGGEIEYT